MRVEGKESFCGQCESMTEERRACLKGGIPKVKQVKLHRNGPANPVSLPGVFVEI